MVPEREWREVCQEQEKQTRASEIRGWLCSLPELPRRAEPFPSAASPVKKPWPELFCPHKSAPGGPASSPCPLTCFPLEQQALWQLPLWTVSPRGRIRGIKPTAQMGSSGS